MQVSYFFATTNELLSKLQFQNNYQNWTIPDFLLFLRCLPCHYDLHNEKFTEKNESYYVILDEKGPLFRVYFIKNNTGLYYIYVIILRMPNLPITKIDSNISYYQMSLWYKNISLKNFNVDIYKLDLHLNFYMLGKKPSTSFYRISKASFVLLKKLVRIFPKNFDVKNEQLLCIEAYSEQQKRNIYKSLAQQIQIIDIMMQHNGVSKIYTHPIVNGEIIINEEKSIHAFSWVAPWSYEVIHKSQYVELDCTFSILDPYVTAIPQFIMNGISIPVGYIAGPQEASELYRLFYMEMQNVIGQSNRLHVLPVLSDEGKGLVKFCSDNGLLHFYCIRHIIEKIGAKSFWGKLIGKLLMSQTENEFEKNLDINMKRANGYYSENTNIPEKFLTYSFLEIKEDKVVKKNDINNEFKRKIVLFKRGFIAAASNHCEGFHRQLKKISKEKKGLEYNLRELYKKINNRFEKYISGESAQKLCTRIKNNLLNDQKKYGIKPVEKCDCSSNVHLKAIIGGDIPCMHTVSEDSNIRILYPKLDEEKFINVKCFKECTSKLQSNISLSNKQKEDQNQDDCEYAIEQIDKAMSRAQLIFKSVEHKIISPNAESIIRSSAIDALKLGLKTNQLDDFVKFYIINVMMNESDEYYIADNNDYLLGKYFAIHEIK